MIYAVNYDESLLIRKDLVDEFHTVHVNKFNDAAFKDFKEKFDKARLSKQEIIPIVIDSYGGECHSVMGMIDLIETSTKPVYTIAVGKAMSCGQVLLTFGHKRFCSPNAQLMMHEITAGSFGKPIEMQVGMDYVDKLNKQLFEKMAIRCGHKKNFFLDLMHKESHTDMYLTPKDGLRLKLIDKIGIPTYQIDVKVEHKYD